MSAGATTRTFLVDTNIFTRRLQANHKHHEAAKAALQTLIERGDDLCVTSQVLIELTGFLTRPLLVRDAQGREVSGGLGLSIAQALDEVQTIQAFCDFRPDTPLIWDEWRRLVVLYPPQGKAVHDARHAAAMKIHGMSHILTFNTKDFNRYAPEGITPLDPRNV